MIREYTLQRSILDMLYKREFKDRDFRVIGFSINFSHESKLKPDIIVIGRLRDPYVFSYLWMMLRKYEEDEAFKGKTVSANLLLDLMASAPLMVIEVKSHITKRDLGQLFVYESYFQQSLLLAIHTDTLMKLPYHIKSALHRLPINILGLDYDKELDIIRGIRIYKLYEEDPLKIYDNAERLRIIFDLVILYDLCSLARNIEDVINSLTSIKESHGEYVDNYTLISKLRSRIANISDIHDDNLIVLLQYMGLMQPLYEYPEHGSVKKVYKILNISNKINILKNFVEYNTIATLGVKFWAMGRPDMLSKFVETMLHKDERILPIIADIDNKYNQLIYGSQDIFKDIVKCINYIYNEL
jgi:hypothetical protein